MVRFILSIVFAGQAREAKVLDEGLGVGDAWVCSAW